MTNEFLKKMYEIYDAPPNVSESTDRQFPPKCTLSAKARRQRDEKRQEEIIKKRKQKPTDEKPKVIFID